MMCKQRAQFVVLGAVLIALWSGDALGRIDRRLFFTSPQNVPVIDAEAVDYLSQEAWNHKYRVFSDPTCLTMLPSGQGGNNEFFFVLDRSQCVLRWFGTIEDVNGERRVQVFKTYGVGPGSSVGRFREPEAVTISPRGPGCYRYVYVLDSGNRRVQKLRFDTCGWEMTSEGFVYSATTAPAGVLDRPQDIDYVALHDDNVVTDDFLVIADTYKHRILGLDTAGNVKWTIGGPAPGHGKNQFCYPIAVTGFRVDAEHNAAFIYVADRGNNRIVRLTQSDTWGISWDRVMELPTNVPRNTNDMGGYSVAGLEDIEVDADQPHSGVFILDSRAGNILQVDYPLSSVVGTYDQLLYRGAPVHDLELSRGELGVVCPYTRSTGLELFEVKASVERLMATPNPVHRGVEWSQISMNIAAKGLLDVWVENQSGQLVKTLLSDWPVYPGSEYTVWDGRNTAGNLVAAGQYFVKVRVDDDYWDYSETKQIAVQLEDTANVRILPLAGGGTVTHPFIADPEWSPDGEDIVYGAENGGVNGVFVYHVDTATEANLTPGIDGQRHLHPAWSPDGTKIAWTKQLVGNAFYVIHKMNRNGSNQVAWSDTMSAPHPIAFFVETEPEWHANGSRIAYLRYGGTDVLVKSRLEQGLPSAILAAGPFGGLTWSPAQAQLALYGPTLLNPNTDVVYVQDINQGHGWTVGEVTGTFGTRTLEGIDWSPTGDLIAYTDYRTWTIGNNQWSVMLVPPSGGNSRPVNGLTSSSAIAAGGISWSPDGTKLVVPIRGTTTTTLAVADVQRESQGAFPSALLFSPLANDTLTGVVTLVGSIQANVGVNGNQLSLPSSYQFYWGRGTRPDSWSVAGFSGVGCIPDCFFANEVLGYWNSGAAPSGEYVLRLVVSDEVDSAVIERPVVVRHKVLTVDLGGSEEFTSIQAAIDAGLPGDTVVVWPGVFNTNVVMRDGVSLIAAAPGVIINGQGNSFTVHIQNLNLPATIRNIEITHTASSTGAGVYVANASPVLEGCVIRDNSGTSATNGSGVRIGQNGAPIFRNCEFRNNSATHGGAVAIWGTGTYAPTASFVNCEFVDNNGKSGKGGAIWMQYAATLDASKQQPSFVGCVFDGNSATDGAAVWIENCYRPVFRSCVFTTNSSTSSAFAGTVASETGPGQSGALFESCTLAANSVALDGAVICVTGLPGGGKTVFVDKSIIAFNINATGTRTGGYESRYDVRQTNLFGNDGGDSYWLSSGGNLSQDPAFCSVETGDYALKAFSPCSSELTGFGSADGNVLMPCWLGLPKCRLSCDSRSDG